jgi:radical SAM protein with 4Fe4S-binding SPASM domain
VFPSKKTRNQMAASLSVRLRRNPPLNKPFHAYVEVTNRCNINCVHCPRVYSEDFKSGTGVGDISLEMVKKLDPFLDKISCITATGFGEPLLNPETLAIVRYLKSTGPAVSMISNGTTVTEEIARELVDIGIDEMWFSMDSPDPKTYKQIRVGAELEDVLANIRRLAQFRDASPGKKPRLAFEIVVMKKNFHQLPQLADLAHDIGIDEIVVQKLFKNNNANYDRFYDLSNLENIDAKEGMRTWNEFLDRMKKHSIVVNSYLGNDVAALFEQDDDPIDRGQKRDPEILGRIDAPTPMASVKGVVSCWGWVLGKAALPEMEICLEGPEESLVLPAPLLTERLDVLEQIPDGYIAEKMCGFAQEIDVSGLPSGSYSLSVRARGGDQAAQAAIAPLQLFVNSKRDFSMYCTQPWSTIYLTWDGRIKTCCYNQYYLGNVNNDGIEDIWHNKLYRDFRNDIVQGTVNSHCADCVAANFQVNIVKPLRHWLPFKK